MAKAGAASERIKTIYVGVYKRLAKDRVKIDGKPDICYDIHYKTGGRYIWEKIGWESEGYTVHDAVIVRGVRIRASRHPELQRLFHHNEQSTSPHLSQRDVTVDEAWHAFKKYWGPNLRSIRHLEAIYGKHIRPRFGKKSFGEINLVALENIKADLLKTLSPGTVKYILSLLRRIFNRCQEFGIVSESTRLPKLLLPKAVYAGGKRERYLNPAEISKLFDCLQLISCMLYGIAKISLHTGMRLGEILALKPCDINLEAGIIHILQSKTGARTAYIPEALRGILQKILKKTKMHTIYSVIIMEKS
jgi:hypothetical protein